MEMKKLLLLTSHRLIFFSSSLLHSVLSGFPCLVFALTHVKREEEEEEEEEGDFLPHDNLCLYILMSNLRRQVFLSIQP